MNSAEDDANNTMGVIEVSGTDAASFLRAQLTNDVGRIGPDRHMLAAWCDAKGRAQAVVRIAQHHDTYLIILPGSLLAPILKRLQMYVLRAKVDLRDSSDRFVIAGYLGAESPAAECTERRGTQLWLGLRGNTGQSARALVLSQIDAETPQNSLDVGGDTWRLSQIDAGLPTVVAATQSLFVPQMLNLHWLMAIDFAKGCYPGQEIIARLHYRGKLTRRLYRFEWAGTLPEAGAAINAADGAAAGTVIMAAEQTTGQGRLLAVVKTSYARSGLSCEQTNLSLLDLPYPTPD